MMRPKIVVIGLILAVFLITPQLLSAVTIDRTFGPFDFTFYNAGAGDSYDTSSANWTDTQMQGFAAAVDAWDTHILNTPARQIKVRVFWSNFSDNTLGTSGNTWFYDWENVWSSTESVWREGKNYDSYYDWDVRINLDIDAAGQNWNFEQDSPTPDEIDYISVLTHELGHSMGWFSSYNSGYDYFGPTGIGITAYDRNIVDSSGNKPANNSKGQPGNFDQTDDPVFWDGENAVDLYGSLVPIYAPGNFAGGSSIVHLDETTFSSLLMSPQIDTGQQIRQISDLEVAMLADMGWTVPEPNSILITIFAATYILARRKTRD